MEIQLFQKNPQILFEETEYLDLIRNTAQVLDLQATSCTVVFVDDASLAAMHAEYLDDPSVTDVITFDLGEDAVEGEIYISTERAAVQAEEFKVNLSEEIARLIIHGLLHLKGFDDLQEKDRVVMKEQEDTLLRQFYK